MTNPYEHSPDGDRLRAYLEWETDTDAPPAVEYRRSDGLTIYEPRSQEQVRDWLAQWREAGWWAMRSALRGMMPPVATCCRASSLGRTTSVTFWNWSMNHGI